VKVLGIESTAHTFGAGLVEDGEVLTNFLSMYVPEKGGIHPAEAAKHHEMVADEIIRKAMSGRPDAVAYSCCPGIGPCLGVGARVAREIALKYKIPVIPVNHASAHIDIGMKATGAVDPVVVYVSGGNTQIIADNGGLRIFGETLDIALGNAIDKLAREMGLAHPGGPKLEALAEKGKFFEMPYTVKGMDLSYSGLFTAAKNSLAKHSQEDVAYSFQEHAFAMLVEVTERAVAHTGKNEVLVVGGVAKNRRLISMLDTMCSERGASLKIVPDEFAGDNGAMIAYSGYLSLKKGFTIPPEKVNIFQKMRIDCDLKKMFTP
jgi:glycoprotease/Kae1 family metallohydrolase